ncbi:MAG TPA: HEPN domain-containing protein [Thermotogota bacterium]|nr:HEPN domain-containing protein [Thermotogota bacterium]
MDNREYWIEIAEYDLETAKAMLDSGRYLYVGFMCHQSIEKILKAIFVTNKNEMPPRIHNLARLLKMIELQEEISLEYLELIHELNPLNIASRYPDQEFEILKDLNHSYSEKLLERTGRLFQWLKTKVL